VDGGDKPGHDKLWKVLGRGWDDLGPPLGMIVVAGMDFGIA
jgi:hypothetical protein